MFTVDEELQVDRATRLLLDVAAVNGRVPVAWMWGEDIRAAHSKWLDYMEKHSLLVIDSEYKAPEDGRICTWLGIPAYPMVAEGIALRTVADVTSGFD